MEQELNTFKNYDFEIKDYFQIEFKGQNVKNTPEFKKWYEGEEKYIKRENNRRKEKYIDETVLFDHNILTIEFCEKCLSYTICSLNNSFSYVICNRCKEEFCIGCPLRRKNRDVEDISTCLKGYLKGLYLRIINRRSELVVTMALFHIMHIIFCLFFTPLFLGFISNYIGLIIHRNKKRVLNENSMSDTKICFYFIYSIFRGLLMFPYIILFLPFMILLLLPGIFSYTYYLYVYDSYIASIIPGNGALRNVGDY